LKPFEMSWQLVLASILLGSVAALVAAYTPALMISRTSLPTALAGRRVDSKGGGGWPLFGLCVAALGMVMILSASNDYDAANSAALGALVLVVGVVFMTPFIIRLIGRTAGFFPLPIRLALRDTSRHTSRSAPAIAAVMAAVAGIVALGIGSLSDDAQGQAEYAFEYPEGTAVVSSGPNAAPVLAAIKAVLPDRTVTPLALANSSQDKSIELLALPCSDQEDRCFWSDPAGYAGAYPPSLVAADVDTLRAWGVTLTPEQTRSLNAGSALVPPGEGPATSGTLGIRVIRFDANDEMDVVADHKLSAEEAHLTIGGDFQGPAPLLAMAVISPATAKALDLDVSGTKFHISGTVTSQQQADLKKAIAAVSTEESGGSLYVERGYQGYVGLIFLLLAVGGGLAVLVGTLCATGLALSDARPDFATMAAVGAAPRTRRIMAAAQALVIGLVGAILGVLTGFAPGVVAARALTNGQAGLGPDVGPIVDIPWSLMGILVIAVPLLAALVSGLFVSSRQVVTRRLAR
ncbi:MAG: hypothetical protein JWP10_775, partial [Nocardioidaceae bacterium]|nr:hypothetical protein [Nocardioidaceae bacterium]